MGSVPAPRAGKATTGIVIAATVVVVLVGLGTLGFVGMIIAYATLHAPPPYVGNDGNDGMEGDEGGVDAEARAARSVDIGGDASAHGADGGGPEQRTRSSGGGEGRE